VTALAFLFIVLVVCGLGGLVLWVQHRQPSTLESGLDAFRREMEALAPPTDDPRPRVRRAKRPTRQGSRSAPDQGH
jgi:hypothetical protein